MCCYIETTANYLSIISTVELKYLTCTCSKYTCSNVHIYSYYIVINHDLP